MSNDGRKISTKAVEDRQNIEPAEWVKDQRVRSLLKEAKVQVNAWRYPNDHPYVRLIKCVEWLLKPDNDDCKR